MCLVATRADQVDGAALRVRAVQKAAQRHRREPVLSVVARASTVRRSTGRANAFHAEQTSSGCPTDGLLAPPRLTWAGLTTSVGRAMQACLGRTTASAIRRALDSR